MDANGWISVKDDLPRLGEEVLVWAVEPTQGEGDDETRWHTGYHVLYYSKRISEWRNWQTEERFTGVTHWQPLPPPPAEAA